VPPSESWNCSRLARPHPAPCAYRHLRAARVSTHNPFAMSAGYPEAAASIPFLRDRRLPKKESSLRARRPCGVGKMGGVGVVCHLGVFSFVAEPSFSLTRHSFFSFLRVFLAWPSLLSCSFSSISYHAPLLGSIAVPPAPLTYRHHGQFMPAFGPAPRKVLPPPIVWAWR